MRNVNEILKPRGLEALYHRWANDSDRLLSRRQPGLLNLYSDLSLTIAPAAKRLEAGAITTYPHGWQP